MDVYGEISPSYKGDLQEALDDDVIANELIWRLKTYAGDWLLQPFCGASLEDFVGKPNTRSIGAEIEARVVDSLVRDGFFSGFLNSVQVTPISAHKVVILINVSSTGPQFTVPFELDLREGISQ